MMADPTVEGGQSTAELAVLLPVLMILVLTVVQVALVARDHVSVQHAARGAARSAAVAPAVSSARDGAAEAGAGLDPGRMAVTLSGGRGSGDVLTVVVDYQAKTDVPLVGRLVGDVELSAEASVRVE